MIPTDWPRAVAHVDADCFYAACELARRPALAGHPLAVMSSQDACVVAKTYEARARGVRTGMPVWEARRLVPDLVLLPADFRHYGLVSERLFRILRRFSPQVERYSIDEAFLDLDGLCGYFRCSHGELADRIRRTVREEVGITVSVGVSTGKVLAKMASESCKPDGTRVVPGRAIGSFLASQPVEAVPGIGPRRAALARKFGIATAAALARLDPRRVDRLLGKAGVDLWRELRGGQAFPVTVEPPVPKSVQRGASLGRRTRDARRVRAQLAHHAFRLALDLTARGLRARRLRVFLRLGDFRHVEAEVPLEEAPTADYGRIARAARRGLARLWRPGLVASGCGVAALGVEPADAPQRSLLPDADAETLPLWRAVAAIRRRHGAGAIAPACTVRPAGTRPEHRFRYPLLHAR